MQPATWIGTGPRARLRNCTPKKDRHSKVPPSPVVSTSRHMNPWVPRGGAAHWWHSSVSPPASELKLPSILRVMPKPTTGDPSSAVDTTVVAVPARRSLLCGVSTRSWSVS